MSCGCSKKTNSETNSETKPILAENIWIKPDEPCLECIKKHISLACTLYFQPSYGKTLNMIHIEGNFAAAELHAETDYPELMEKIRILRKKYMSDYTSLFEKDFVELREYIDSLV